MHKTRIERERAFLVAVQARRSGARGGSWDVESSLDELGRLVNTAGGRVVGKTIQKLDSPHPAQYVGAGRLTDIVAQRETIGYNLVTTSTVGLAGVCMPHSHFDWLCGRAIMATHPLR